MYKFLNGNCHGICCRCHKNWCKLASLVGSIGICCRILHDSPSHSAKNRCKTSNHHSTIFYLKSQILRINLMSLTCISCNPLISSTPCPSTTRTWHPISTSSHLPLWHNELAARLPSPSGLRLEFFRVSNWPKLFGHKGKLGPLRSPMGQGQWWIPPDGKLHYFWTLSSNTVG